MRSIVFGLGAFLTSCTVQPKNEAQRVAMEVVQAAEDGDTEKLALLTKGAKLSPYLSPPYNFTLKQTLAPSKCRVERLIGPNYPEKNVIHVEWECTYIQGHHVYLTEQDGKITEIYWHPEE